MNRHRSFTSHLSPWGLIVAALMTALSLSACTPKYPKCKKDKHCKQGEFCVNGLCQQCRSNSDCGAGKRCAAGYCEPIPGYCSSTKDCAEGQTCEGNLCVTPRVSSEPEAPAAAPVAQPTTCSTPTIYFEFDSDALDEATRNALEATVRCLQQRTFNKLRLTGYCDPRGTEEYNLALGDRRARSVQQYMSSLGIEAAKLAVTSMGEEMASQNEAEWPKDRKVEFATE